MFNMFKKVSQEECKIFFVNETTREVAFVKAKAKEGKIHYKDKVWLVQTDPLFFENKALYVVSDKQIPTFDMKLGLIPDNGEIKERETQNAIKTESLSPTALKSAVTSEFFKALMAPIYWSRGDWIKAIGVGFAFYVLIKWIILAVFKVPLP